MKYKVSVGQRDRLCYFLIKKKKKKRTLTSFQRGLADCYELR